jgi:hypothetical protein
LIQRLQNSRVHRRDHIHCRIQLFFRHPSFPCVRKAPVNSRVAEPHHRDGKTDEHLLPLGETLHGMGVAIESSKICFLQFRFPFFGLGRRDVSITRSTDQPYYNLQVAKNPFTPFDQAQGER